MKECKHFKNRACAFEECIDSCLAFNEVSEKMRGFPKMFIKSNMETVEEMENIKIKFKDGELLEFVGKYIGHTNPKGIKTNRWHYYESDMCSIFHIVKDKIKYVISKKIK